MENSSMRKNSFMRFGQFLVPAAAGSIAATSGAGAVFIALAVLLGTSIFSVKRN